LIPIDFADLQGKSEISNEVESQTQLVTDWYKYVSSGRLNVNWTITNKWIRLPGPSIDYAVPQSGSYPETTNFWRKVIQKIDEEVDLTNITNIVFLLPDSQTIVPVSVQSFPWMPEMQGYNSKKGKVLSFSLAGKNFTDSRYWSYWAHEFGHVIGLAHVGSSYLPWGEFSMYDLLGHQDGPTKELSGWMRFIAGWLEDKQVYCQDINELSQVSLSLRPLSSADLGLKLAVIKTSENNAVIIESRRVTKFSCFTPSSLNGILVYKYDARLANQQTFLTPFIPDGRTVDKNACNNPFTNYMLYPGDEANFEGIKVSYISNGNSDQVVVTKNG
jgi:M6 family metalloprotease-like protein